jgi:uncharacterized RDD family membrane protein YckC
VVNGGSDGTAPGDRGPDEGAPRWDWGPGERPAGLVPRAVAKLIDGMVLALIALVLVVPLFAPDDPALAVDVGVDSSELLGTVVTTLLSIGYYAVLESRRGRTLGKLAMRIEVHGPDGGPPTLEQAIRRNAYMALAVIPQLGTIAQLAAIVAVAASIARDPGRQGLHDRFAGGTSVVMRA